MSEFDDMREFYERSTTFRKQLEAATGAAADAGHIPLRILMPSEDDPCPKKQARVHLEHYKYVAHTTIKQIRGGLPMSRSEMDAIDEALDGKFESLWDEYESSWDDTTEEISPPVSYDPKDASISIGGIISGVPADGDLLTTNSTPAGTGSDVGVSPPSPPSPTSGPIFEGIVMIVRPAGTYYDITVQTADGKSYTGLCTYVPKLGSRVRWDNAGSLWRPVTNDLSAGPAACDCGGTAARTSHSDWCSINL